MKRIIKDYLYFSKQERIAVIILLLLMAIFLAAPYLYQPKFEPPVINQALADWLTENSDSSKEEKAFSGTELTSPRSVNLFPFDPNTASAEDWQSLGIPDKTVRTILNYRNRGGKFRHAADIGKIWGISTSDAERLKPYVRIAGQEQGSMLNNDLRHAPGSTPKKEPVIIDINKAGVSDWAALPGIGEVLSNRIVRYREKIGGFRSIEQVGKTYGISDSLFRSIQAYLRYGAGNLARINLNTASVYALGQAGIDQRFARELVRYREQNGPYRSLEELHKLVDLPDSAWQKLVSLVRVE